MLELMQKGLCNRFHANLGPFESNFTFQGLWLKFLVKLIVTGFGTFFYKVEISLAYTSMEVHI